MCVIDFGPLWPEWAQLWQTSVQTWSARSMFDSKFPESGSSLAEFGQTSANPKPSVAYPQHMGTAPHCGILRRLVGVESCKMPEAMLRKPTHVIRRYSVSPPPPPSPGGLSGRSTLRAHILWSFARLPTLAEIEPTSAEPAPTHGGLMWPEIAPNSAGDRRTMAGDLAEARGQKENGRTRPNLAGPGPKSPQLGPNHGAHSPKSGHTFA